MVASAIAAGSVYLVIILLASVAAIPLMIVTKMGLMAAKKIYLGLDLLDWVLLDSDGHRCRKVDDLELTVAGDARDTAPRVTVILTGPGALSSRLWGWPGRVARLMWRRMSPNPAGRRSRVPVEAIDSVDYDIHLK